jgi:hypothetical protein
MTMLTQALSRSPKIDIMCAGRLCSAGWRKLTGVSVSVRPVTTSGCFAAARTTTESATSAGRLRSRARGAL